MPTKEPRGRDDALLLSSLSLLTSLATHVTLPVSSSAHGMGPVARCRFSDGHGRLLVFFSTTRYLPPPPLPTNTHTSACLPPPPPPIYTEGRRTRVVGT